MMNNYPDYFPSFMQDFHDQKDLFKAFFVYRAMLDRRNDSSVASRSNWMDFMIVFASFVDFLYTHGWQLYRSRSNKNPLDIETSTQSLLALELAWFALGGDDLQPGNRQKYVHEPMQKWAEWLEYMPDGVKEAWLKELGGNDENIQDQTV